MLNWRIKTVLIFWPRIVNLKGLRTRSPIPLSPTLYSQQNCGINCTTIILVTKHHRYFVIYLYVSTCIQQNVCLFHYDDEWASHNMYKCTQQHNFFRKTKIFFSGPNWPSHLVKFSSFFSFFLLGLCFYVGMSW